MNLRKQILTRNSCYLAGKVIIPKGVMIHSTGANNPYISRYVQPNDGLLGVNKYDNHWNQSNAEWQAKFDTKLNKCVHAFIGKLTDGSIATYQTLPWNYRGWHAGHEIGNDRYIGFEICEDGLDDKKYFEKVYREAVELTAYLCKLYKFNPLEDGVVICHSEGHKRKIASGHGDVEHWFPRFGKTMDDFRKDVATEMEEDEVTQEQFDKMLDNWLERKAKEPASKWAKPYVEAAKKQDIADGTRPRAFVTREEVMTMLLAVKNS